MSIEIFLIIITAAAINFLILHYLISSATMTKQRNWHEQVQTKLLTRIAEKQGVSPEEIRECFNVKV